MGNISVLFISVKVLFSPACMTIRIIGEHPFARDDLARLKSRIGTVFPRTRTLVTLPGIHATQRIAYVQALNADRRASAFPPLTEEEEMVEWQQSVDLIIDRDTILIRPDPENMPLAFEADDLLQELVSKQNIKFLNLMNDRVRQAIKERGENWRIAPLPRSREEMNIMIRAASLPMGGRALCYYSQLTGTRYITYAQFCELGQLPDGELFVQLRDLRDTFTRYNRLGQPEVAFFALSPNFRADRFPKREIASLSAETVRPCYEAIRTGFEAAVPPPLRDDNPANPEWRNRMFSALIGQGETPISEETMLGLGSEFFMQVEWLPGGRMEEGELMFDTIFDEFERSPNAPELRQLCDDRARGIIFNFVREFGDIDYVNIGRVIGSLSNRPASVGRRDVFVAEVKRRDTPTPIIRILRMQKWGIREHLDEQKDLLTSIIQAEEYTDYVLDRRLGCRQLGMNLSARVTTRKLTERYHGWRREYEGQTIWSTYFERDYIVGIATDKIPRSRFRDPAYSLKFAELLGGAAAPNIIVGRMNLEGRVLFDDGDEVMVEDGAGLPVDLLVSDLTGTFVDFTTELERQAASYAEPINRRLAFLPNPSTVAAAYIGALLDRFLHIQREYRKRKRAFDTLFKHRPRDEQGSYAFRWEKVLERLNRTDPVALAERIRRSIRLPDEPTSIVPNP